MIAALPEQPVALDGILYRADTVAADFVRARLGGEPFSNYRALGAVSGGQLVGGLVWHAWTPWGCDIAIASDTPRWVTRAAIRRLCAFTFVHLARRRVSARARSGDGRVLGLLTRLGFEMEGVHARDYDGEQDAVSFGMTADRCRWMGAPT